MSDLGDAAGEVLGLWIVGPLAVILCIIGIPIMLIQECSHKDDVPPSPPPKKESIGFKAGQEVKKQSKDFIRGVFTKENN